MAAFDLNELKQHTVARLHCQGLPVSVVLPFRKCADLRAAAENCNLASLGFEKLFKDRLIHAISHKTKKTKLHLLNVACTLYTSLPLCLTYPLELNFSQSSNDGPSIDYWHKTCALFCYDASSLLSLSALYDASPITFVVQSYEDPCDFVVGMTCVTLERKFVEVKDAVEKSSLKFMRSRRSNSGVVDVTDRRSKKCRDSGASKRSEEPTPTISNDATNEKTRDKEEAINFLPIRYINVTCEAESLVIVSLAIYAAVMHCISMSSSPDSLLDLVANHLLDAKFNIPLINETVLVVGRSDLAQMDEDVELTVLNDAATTLMECIVSYV